MNGDTQEGIEDEIRARAHAIWEAQGHPEGLAEQHWQQASAEILKARDAGSALSNPLATGAAADALSEPASGTGKREKR